MMITVIVITVSDLVLRDSSVLCLQFRYNSQTVCYRVGRFHPDKAVILGDQRAIQRSGGRRPSTPLFFHDLAEDDGPRRLHAPALARDGARTANSRLQRPVDHSARYSVENNRTCYEIRALQADHHTATLQLGIL